MQISINKIAVVSVLAAGIFAPGCVTAGKYYALEQELMRAEDALSLSEDELQYSQENLESAEQYLTQAGATAQRANQLERDLNDAEARAQMLEEKLRTVGGRQEDLAAVGLEEIINADEGMIGYRGEGDIFFTSGQDNLTGKGKAAVDQIVDRLQQTEYPIRIDGHTDSDPIVATKAKWPRGNIMLAAHRAMSVRDYLISKGVPAERITIASFGPFKPISNGADAASKAKNRRVEIMLKVTEGSGN
ncbi:MAG: chemotaxis protein MotB [Pseudohongiellaceae bacterium]|jgi:chemotaxis protein MotB